MSRALLPNFALAPLRPARSGYGMSPESWGATHEEPAAFEIRALGGGRLTPFVTSRVLRAWYRAAARYQVSLVVLCSGDSIGLYSTQRDSAAASTAPLGTLAQWSRLHPEFRRLNVRFIRGVDVAEHLLVRAAVAGSRLAVAAQQNDMASSVAAARELGSLGTTTALLFHAALRVSRRTAEEGLDSALGFGQGSDYRADAAIVRIVEEELLIWKTQQAEHYRSFSCAAPARSRLPSGHQAEHLSPFGSWTIR